MLSRTTRSAFGVACAALAASYVSAQSNCPSREQFVWFPQVAAIGNGGIGYCVASSLDGAVVGVGWPGFVQQGLEIGAVLLVTNPGGSASQQWTIPAPTPVFLSYFGTEIALSSTGDVLAVGAPGGNPVPGRCYVYRRGSSGWAQEATLDGVSLDSFGHSVVLSGDGETLVVGAPLRQPAIFTFGAVCTYRKLSTGWTLESTIVPADLPQSSYIGNVLALSRDGQVLAIRSFASPNEPIASGAVYIMRRVATGWVQEARLQEPVDYSGCCFGMALAMDATGDTLVAGNWSDGRAGAVAGAVTVFRRGTAGWAYETSFPSIAPNANGKFGTAVELNSGGDRMVVGMPGAKLAGVTVGAVEEYVWNTAGWTHAATHYSRVPTAVSGLGNSVDMDAVGRRWFAGEHRGDLFGLNAGMVHVFDVPCLGPNVYCTAQTNSLGCVPAIDAQGTPSVSSSSGFRISAPQIRNRQNGMLLYGTAGRAALPWLGGTLCVQPPLRRTPLVNSGGAAPPVNDCSGVLARDFNAWTWAATDPALFVGQHVRAQFYSRDPGAAASVNLTDAVEFYLEP